MSNNLMKLHLQDLFAELQPNMTRYSSIEEVNAAFVELEEHERSVSSDKSNTEKHLDAEKPMSRATSNTTSTNGRDTVNGSRENGAAHGDGVDSDSDTGSGTIEAEGRDDEESDLGNHEDGCDSDDDEDDEEAGGPASDEDDEVHVRQKVPEVDPREEANFDQELRAVMQARIIFVITLFSCHDTMNATARSIFF